VRRETGKELMVRVHYDEGVAIHMAAEVIMDLGIGDIFNCRVAGNVAAWRVIAPSTRARSIDDDRAIIEYVSLTESPREKMIIMSSVNCFAQTLHQF
jgi:hypothetical protein